MVVPLLALVFVRPDGDSLNTHFRGFKKPVGLADFLCYLEELVDAFGTQALPAGEVERLLEVYRRIGEAAGRDPAEEERFPLLTEGGSLVDPQDAFYADGPWFQDRIKDPRVQFLHRGLPWWKKG
jgi:hypothetical protein